MQIYGAEVKLNMRFTLVFGQMSNGKSRMKVLRNNLTRTYPIVIHNPFEFPDWQEIISVAMGAPPAKADHRLTIMTFNNQAEKNLLQQNLEKMGVTPLVLGGTVKTWSNLCKIELTYSALKTISSPYVMGCDGRDVCFLKSPSHVLERFIETRKAMLFNATYVNWPPFESYKTKEKDLHPDDCFCFLNGGVWIARTDRAREFFQDVETLRLDKALLSKIEAFIDKKPLSHKNLIRNSEQSVIRPVYHRCFPDVDIDAQCYIFQVLQDEPMKWRKHTVEIANIVRLEENKALKEEERQAQEADGRSDL